MCINSYDVSELNYIDVPSYLYEQESSGKSALVHRLILTFTSCLRNNSYYYLMTRPKKIDVPADQKSIVK